jgi:hypothetical protein
VEVADAEDQGLATLSVTVPKSETGGFVNNKKEIYNFQYGTLKAWGRDNQEGWSEQSTVVNVIQVPP